MHAEQRTPPYGLSGLLQVLGRFLISADAARGTPLSSMPQPLHCGAAGLLDLYCFESLPPGVFLTTFLTEPDLNLGATMSKKISGFFIKFLITAR
jgi:hypothetical protein